MWRHRGINLNKALESLTSNKYKLVVYLNSVLNSDTNDIIVDPVWTLSGGISPLDVRFILGYSLTNENIEKMKFGSVYHCSFPRLFDIIKLDNDVKNSYDVSSIAGIPDWLSKKKNIHDYSRGRKEEKYH